MWSRRTECEHIRDHWPRFCRDVGAVLQQNNTIEQNLILAMPFYEMESWAFANTAHLRKILMNPADLNILAKWEADLTRLEEEANIKDMLTIQDSRNFELVLIKNGFPSATLRISEKTFQPETRRDPWRAPGSPAAAR